MRSERIASLSNYVMSDVMNPMLVASTQWFEPVSYTHLDVYKRQDRQCNL